MLRFLLPTFLLFLTLSLAAQGREMQFGDPSNEVNSDQSLYRSNGNLLFLSHETGKGLTLKEYNNANEVVAEMTSIPSPRVLGARRIIEGSDQKIYFLQFDNQDDSTYYGVNRTQIASDLSSIEGKFIDTFGIKLPGESRRMYSFLFTDNGGYATEVKDSTTTLVTYKYNTWNYDTVEVYRQDLFMRPYFEYNDSLYFYASNTVCSINGHSGDFYAYPLDGSSFYPQVFRPKEVFGDLESSIRTYSGIYVNKPFVIKNLWRGSRPPYVTTCFPRRECSTKLLPSSIERVIGYSISEQDIYEAYLVIDRDTVNPYKFLRYDLGVPYLDTLQFPSSQQALSTNSLVLINVEIQNKYTLRIASENGLPHLQYTIPFTGVANSIMPETVSDTLYRNYETSGNVFWMGENALVLGTDQKGYFVSPSDREVLSTHFLEKSIRSFYSDGWSELTRARQNEPNGDVYLPLAHHDGSSINYGYYSFQANTLSVDSFSTTFQWNAFAAQIVSGAISTQGGIAFINDDLLGNYEIVYLKLNSANELTEEFRAIGQIPNYSDYTLLRIDDISFNEASNSYAVAITSYEDQSSCTATFLNAGYPHVHSFTPDGILIGTNDFDLTSGGGSIPVDYLRNNSLSRPTLSPVLDGWRYSRGRSTKFFAELLLDQRTSDYEVYVSTERSNSDHFIPTPTGFIELIDDTNSVLALKHERIDPFNLDFNILPSFRVDSTRNDANDYAWNPVTEMLIGTGNERITDPAWVDNPVTIDRQIWIRAANVGALISNTGNTIRPETDLVLYPNPVSTLLNVKSYERSSPSKATKSTFRIVDFKGSVAYEGNMEAGQAAFNVDVSSLAPGMYTLVTSYGQSRRFIKTNAK